MKRLTRTAPAAPAPRWLDAVVDPAAPAPQTTPLIGILPGEGIGPEIIDAALDVLTACEAAGLCPALTRRFGRDVPIGKLARPDGAITPPSAAFCQGVLADGGALFCGPGGGRFVYDLRHHFDLFCKLVPLHDVPALHRRARLKESALRNLDVLVVRDNAAGVYQGTWSTRDDPAHGRTARHTFAYTESQVARIASVGARLARTRRGVIDVVLKDGGVPAISDLWRDVASAVARSRGVTARFLNVDFAAYALVDDPRRFDVLVTPNLCGDILADLGALFCGSRGLTFSANFSAAGHAVYQTGHGAAHDLANTGRANPLGQIYSLAMMLRQSFAQPRAAALIERAVNDVLAAGFRTDDVLEPGCRPVGTRDMGRHVAAALTALATAPSAQSVVVPA